ncbi:MAG: hypothetical protein JWN91_3903 [Nocardioides sp.]|jgi:hypothetical protein|nr:hypothetical protein [Nocardioides sp.]
MMLRRLAAPLAALALLVGLLAGGASPANAAFNLAVDKPVQGTDCRVTVGTWPNTAAYPGLAMQVHNCGSRHTIQIQGQLQWAGTNLVPYEFFTTPWFTYTNAYGTREHDYYKASCPAGRWNWRVVVWVYVDGVYRGAYDNGWHNWQACTTF